MKDPTYEGNYFPSIFEMEKKFPKEKPRCAAINKRLRLQYSTDAMNDYLNRKREPGEYKLMLNDEVYPFYVLNLWNGYANLNINLPPKVKEGDVLHFRSTLMDNSRTEPFEEEFFVIIGEKQTTEPSDSDRKRKIKGDKDDKQSDKNDKMNLPEVVEVRRDEWAHYGFTHETALNVTHNGNTWDYFINMDNLYLQHEMKANTRIDVKLMEARYKYGLTLFAISMLKDGDEDDTNGSVEEKVRDATKSLARVLLPTIDSLGTLDVESVSDQTEDRQMSTEVSTMQPMQDAVWS